MFNWYSWSLLAVTVMGWASWAVVLYKLSPFNFGYVALILFYASLFVALSGTFSLISYYFRGWLTSDAPRIVLRQGILISLMVITALVFQRLRVLTWWDALLLLVIVLLVEFYFWARE